MSELSTVNPPLEQQEITNDVILWLWFCTECGGIWISDCDGEGCAVNACPKDPVEHAGAMIWWIVEVADYATATVEDVWGYRPDYENLVKTFSPWHGDWDTLIKDYPVQRCAEHAPQRDPYYKPL